MPRRSYTPEKIINKLREAEVLLSQGSTVEEAARKTDVPSSWLFSEKYSQMLIRDSTSFYSSTLSR